MAHTSAVRVEQTSGQWRVVSGEERHQGHLIATTDWCFVADPQGVVLGSSQCLAAEWTDGGHQVWARLADGW